MVIYMLFTMFASDEPIDTAKYTAFIKNSFDNIGGKSREFRLILCIPVILCHFVTINSQVSSISVSSVQVSSAPKHVSDCSIQQGRFHIVAKKMYMPC